MDDLIAQNIYKIAGKNVPLTIDRDFNGTLVDVKYETSWKEGGTTPVERKTKAGTIIEYKENYTDVALSNSEIKKIDDYISDLLAGN